MAEYKTSRLTGKIMWAVDHDAKAYLVTVGPRALQPLTLLDKYVVCTVEEPKRSFIVFENDMYFQKECAEKRAEMYAEQDRKIKEQYQSDLMQSVMKACDEDPDFRAQLQDRLAERGE